MRYKPFFRREAEANGEIPEIWYYDILPNNVRIQIWQIFTKNDENYWVDETSEVVCEFLSHEIGVEYLAYRKYYNEFDQRDYTRELKEFFINTQDYKEAFSVVECLLRIINHGSKNKKPNYEKAVDEINYRLREARVGYEFNKDANLLIKKSSEAAYQLSIEPAFHLLSDLQFKESINNFAKAFSDYQSGTPKDLESSVTNALKALESTVQNICVLKGYSFNKEKPLKDQVEVLKSNHFLQKKYDNYLTKITELIVAVATPRNKIAGHGQADTNVNIIDDKLVEFVLAQVASVIVFLTRNI